MPDLNSLCLGCMNELPHPQATCPYCGWSKATGQNNADLLPQNTRLRNPVNGNEYLIGKALGQGGFGVVYIAWDINHDRRVAIKEYYPTQFVSRSHTRTVVPKNNNQRDIDLFNKQKLRFLEEAQKMQLFADSPNVVDVLDFFDANKTSYIVMEFIEGQTFAQVLNREPSRRLSYDPAVYNLKPIADILQRIHHTPWQDGSGIVHRDVSPENIMYASDGTVKLLDFGAARVSDPGDPPTGIIKRGYSPYEQELSVPGPDALQGTWTDVYAFAATIYRAITGEVPPNALERSAQDTLIPPSQFGLTFDQEQVLLKGLAIKRYDRYQTIDEFYGDLYKLIGQVNGGGQVNGNSGGKTAPVLTVGQFTQNGNTYTAQINYNGDGSLSTSLGFINGNILSVTNPDGNFNGVVNASEGTNFLPAQIYFSGPGEVKTPVNPVWQKIAWAVAAVAAVAAILLFNRVSSAQEELDGVELLIRSAESKLERYQSFAADYGYASSDFYADKPIVFLSKNSEAIIPIYCGVLKDKDTDKPKPNMMVAGGIVDGDNVITPPRSAGLEKDYKMYITIRSKNTAGYATIKFINDVNSDSFYVLAVVK